MERKNYRLLAMAIVLGTVLVLSACSDNDNNFTSDSSAANQAGLQLAVQGPLDYDWLLGTEQVTAESPLSVSATGSAAEEGAEVALSAATSVLTSLDNPVKLVTSGIKLILAPFKIWQDVVNDKTKEQEKTDVETAFNILFEEVDELQEEIKKLHNEILDENQILQYYVTQFDSEMECTALQNYVAAVQTVYVGLVTAPPSTMGCSIANAASGVVNEFVGYLNPYYTYATESTPGSLDLIGAATDLDLIKNLRTTVQDFNVKNPQLSDYLNSISGTTFSVDVMKELTKTVNNTCATGSGSALVDQLACLYSFLVESGLPEAGTLYTVPHPRGATEVSNNFVDTLEGYNDFVMLIYQQGMSALSAAMLMEMLTSTLNYINYGNACLGSPQTPGALLQIDSWEPDFGTVYASSEISLNEGKNYPVCFNQKTCSLSADDAQTSYKESITGMLMLFAARMNALWDTVMLNVISDCPLSEQDPYTTLTIKLENGQQKTLPSQGSIVAPQNAITLKNPAYDDMPVNLYRVPMLSMSGDAVLYQYGNIMDVYGCMEEFLGRSESTCKAAFPDGDGGTYDGQSVVALVPDSDEEGGLTPTATLDLSFCDVSTGHDTYIFNGDTPWCVTPAGTKFVNSTALTSNSTMPQGAYPYFYWALADNGYVQGTCPQLGGIGLDVSAYTDQNPGQQYNLNFSLSPTPFPQGETGVWGEGGSPCGFYNKAFTPGQYFKVVGAADTDKALFYLNASNMKPPSTDSGLSYTTFAALDPGAVHADCQIPYTVGYATVVSEVSGSTWEINPIAGFTENDYDYQHTLLLQLNLPNGYRMPVYYMTYQAGGGDDNKEKHAGDWSANKVLCFCPTTLMGWNLIDGEAGTTFGNIEPENPFPGLQNCAEMEDGSLVIETTDGTNYYLSADHGCDQSLTLYQLSTSQFD